MAQEDKATSLGMHYTWNRPMRDANDKGETKMKDAVEMRMPEGQTLQDEFSVMEVLELVFEKFDGRKRYVEIRLYFPDQPSLNMSVFEVEDLERVKERVMREMYERTLSNVVVEENESGVSLFFVRWPKVVP